MTPLEAARLLGERAYRVVDDAEIQPGTFAAHTECRFCERDCGPEWGSHAADCPADDIPRIVAALEAAERIAHPTEPDTLWRAIGALMAAFKGTEVTA